MLEEWQNKVTPTWSAVVQALVEIGMRRLASELAQKHGWLNSDLLIVHVFSVLNVLNSGTPPSKLPDSDPLDKLEDITQQKEEVRCM